MPTIIEPYPDRNVSYCPKNFARHIPVGNKKLVAFARAISVFLPRRPPLMVFVLGMRAQAVLTIIAPHPDKIVSPYPEIILGDILVLVVLSLLSL